MIGVGAAGPTGPAGGAEPSPAMERGQHGPHAPALAPRRPTGLTEREAWAVLMTAVGLGPVGFAGLLRRHGTAGEVLRLGATAAGQRHLLAAWPEDERPDRAPGVVNGIAEVARDPAAAAARIATAGVEILTLDDAAYPDRLRAIEMPPPVLFLRGDPAALERAHAIAIVGTRRATETGRRTAARIAAAVARTGAAVVSGLAVGIDGAAHAAAVAEDGTTVAVLGSGHGRLYPSAHQALARSIVAGGGAVISELAPHYEPTTSTFPRRNRLISGLADATIVVEAGARSGALITAAWALEQGRECFFVPGPIDAPRSAGCLAWLREYPGQARIVAGIPELVEDLGLIDDTTDGTGTEATTRSGRPARPSLEAELIEVGATARAVALQLVAGRGTLDELVAATGFPVATALGALTLLELRGLATTTYGRYRPAGRLASADPPAA